MKKHFKKFEKYEYDEEKECYGYLPKEYKKYSGECILINRVVEKCPYDGLGMGKCELYNSNFWQLKKHLERVYGKEHTEKYSYKKKTKAKTQTKENKT